MKVFTTLLLTAFCSTVLLAQTNIQKLVDTEHAFARSAAENGTKKAFLEFLASDGLVFVPDRTNGVEYWSARTPNASLLSWAPNYADVSSSGLLGYTTGNWEFRPKGKDDTPTAFGDFITVWLRQPEGKYKFVIDIGVGHDKPATYSTEWTTTAEKEKNTNQNNSSPADISNNFLRTAEESGLTDAYKLFGSNDIRMFREGKLPIIGLKNAVALIKKNKPVVLFSRRSSFFGSGDISYNLGTYTMSENGKVTEKGNSLQIWKLTRGGWKVVLDILKPVPAK